MSKPAEQANLRRHAEAASGSLPPLMVQAKHLANTVSMGVHGRKRAGMGESFWQYRQALPGDDLATIDWRRSGRSDSVYIREREWEAAHTVAIWADNALAMDYRGKGERAKTIALALAILLSKGGERIAIPATQAAQPRSGEAQLQRITRVLTEAKETREEYGSVPEFGNLKAARSVFLSDFLGPDDQVFDGLNAAAERAGSGCIIQVLDRSEEAFPFTGRTIFESMGGAQKFETYRAKALRAEYRERMETRTGKLEEFARRTGWQFKKHYVNDSASAALLWAYMAIGEGQ